MSEFDFSSVPDVLRERAQWVVWRLEQRGGEEKPTKVPYTVRTGARASSDNPATWATFDLAVSALEASQGWAKRPPYSGIGYVFAKEDPFVGVDIDKVIDPDSGAIDEEAEAAIRLLDTYTEISPSGTGVKLWLRAEKRGTKCRTGQYETYDSYRFFTVTGRVRAGSPPEINDRQAQYDLFYAKLFPPREPGPLNSGASPGTFATFDDNAVLDAAFDAKNGHLVRALWAGETSGHSNNQSSADLALCNHLAFYCRGDVDQLDRLFRASGLYRAKWDAKHASDGRTYGAMTIAKAMEGRTEFWAGPAQPGRGHRKRESVSRERGEPADDVAPFGEGGASVADPGDDPDREASLLEGAPALRNDLPAVETYDTHLRERAACAYGHLLAANDPPKIFVRGRSLVRVEVDRKGNPSIADHDVATIRHHFKDVVRFVSTSWSEKAKGFKQLAVKAPQDQLEDLLRSGSWPGVPTLEAVVSSPFFRPDRQLVTETGYDPVSQFYYHNGLGLEIGDTTPEPHRVREAKELIFGDLLYDFPFADQSSRAHALALILLPFVRSLIDGQTPLHLIDAPRGGSGKTFLARVCAGLFLGPNVSMVDAPVNPEEWTKVITGVAQAGRSHFMIDNADRLKGTGLLAALTMPVWEGRELGKTQMVSARLRQVWVVTCNNISAGEEYTRRSIWIRLDPGVERPEDRTGFKHDPIFRWLDVNRSLLVTACLTLIRAWIEAGCPPCPSSVPAYGSYEEWREVIGGIFEVIGVKGLLSNRDALRERAESDEAAWYQFTDAWRRKFPTEEDAGVADLYEIALEFLGDRLGDGGERSQKTRLGRQLHAHCDRQYNGWRIERAGRGTTGATKGAQLYVLKKVAPRPGESGEHPNVGEPFSPPSSIGISSSLINKEEVRNDSHLYIGPENVPQGSEVPLTGTSDEDDIG